MFKTGDKVKVREDIRLNEQYDNGCLVVQDMYNQRGKCGKVIHIPKDSPDRYVLDVCKEGWCFSDSMLERIEDMNISERLSEVIKENQKLKQQLSEQNIKLNKIQADARREQGVSDEEFREVYKFFSGSNKNVHATVWGNLYLENIFSNLSLSEFVNKYKEYKDKQDEIKVGNEISYIKAGERFKGAVLQVFNDGEGYKVFCENGCGQLVYPSEKIEKTGRHFDEVESLLSKLKEGD